MIREAFKLVLGPKGPVITRVEITDSEGLSWQGAKKELRLLYISQAQALRGVSKESYFAEATTEGGVV